MPSFNYVKKCLTFFFQADIIQGGLPVYTVQGVSYKVLFLNQLFWLDQKQKLVVMIHPHEHKRWKFISNASFATVPVLKSAYLKKEKPCFLKKIRYLFECFRQKSISFWCSPQIYQAFQDKG